jgi:hypothetical protein
MVAGLGFLDFCDRRRQCLFGEMSATIRQEFRERGQLWLLAQSFLRDPRLLKWRNILAVRIPKPTADKAKMRMEDPLEIELAGQECIQLQRDRCGCDAIADRTRCEVMLLAVWALKCREQANSQIDPSKNENRTLWSTH